MDAAAELGRNPVSKHHIQPEYSINHDSILASLVISRIFEVKYLTFFTSKDGFLMAANNGPKSCSERVKSYFRK